MQKQFFLTFLATGLIFGVLFTWQLRTKIPIVGNFPSDEVEAKQELLKSFLDEQSYLQSRIVSLRGDLEEAQRNLEYQTETINFEKLDALKKEIGLTEISGEGLEIFLDDSPLAIREGAEVSDQSLVQASDIRDILNILFAADADAISINGQRVIATSPITSVGTTILINNSHIAPPFNISTVGDTDIILQRLLNVNLLSSIYEKRSKQNIKFEIFKKNRVIVPIYNGDLKVSHLNPVKQ